METGLKLKDLYFGEVDAKYEVISGDDNDIEKFFRSFLIPNNLVMNEFLDGKITYIIGLKGTGKTALLRYISLEAKHRGYNTCFILFKTDFDKQIKQNIAHAAKVIMTGYNIDEHENGTNNEEDYALVWRYYLHKQIVFNNNEETVFKHNGPWNKYKSLISFLEKDEDENYLFPHIKKGAVKLNISALEWVNVGIDMDWENKNDRTVKFSNYVKRIDNLFKKLSHSDGKLYVFIDELELSFNTRKEFLRDTKIIAGLVIAIKQLYSICLENSFKIKFICALRSEIVKSVEITGNEINKELEGFGTSISWHQSGGALKDHPLMKLIKKRLRTCEGESCIEPDDQLFKKYFPQTIQTVDAERFILELSWERPRDIVRLLSLATKRFPEDTTFSHEVFDTIRKDYASYSWSELSEELRAKYDVESLDAIKQIFIGIMSPFDLRDFENEIIQKKALYPKKINLLIEKYDPKEILVDLYRIGVIGNFKGHRFSYKGYNDLILTQPMMVHRALWTYFGTKRNNKYMPKAFLL
jgi:hypothetical protein